MSWCRWSSVLDSGEQSDLYIYEAVWGGVVIHVASNRRVGAIDAPKLPSLTSGASSEDWLACYRLRLEWMKNHKEIEPIGLPEDGKSFSLLEPEDIYEKLSELKKMGYRFPDSVWDRLQEYQTADHKDFGEIFLEQNNNDI